MRRTLAALATAALALTAIAAGDGVDAAEIAEPIEFAFHLHGDEDAPLTDDEVYGTSGNQTMDLIAATGDPQTRQLVNGVVSPNTACSENALFPTWTGWVGRGTVVGDATLTIDVVGGMGGDVDIRVWTDTTGGCNEENVAPHVLATGTMPIGAGTMQVTIPTDGLDPHFEMKIMLVAADTSPTSQGRFVYDGADYDATLSFTCQPDAIPTDEAGEPEYANADCLPF